MQVNLVHESHNMSPMYASIALIQAFINFMHIHKQILFIHYLCSYVYVSCPVTMSQYICASSPVIFISPLYLKSLMEDPLLVTSIVIIICSSVSMHVCVDVEEMVHQ